MATNLNQAEKKNIIEQSLEHERLADAALKRAPIPSTHQDLIEKQPFHSATPLATQAQHQANETQYTSDGKPKLTAAEAEEMRLRSLKRAPASTTDHITPENHVPVAVTKQRLSPEEAEEMRLAALKRVPAPAHAQHDEHKLLNLPNTILIMT